MIVILAVIALIATPLIMGTITKAKKNALIDTAYGIIKAGENYQVSRNFDSSGDISNLIIDDLVTDTTLAYKGTKPKAGRLIINQKGESAIAIWSGQFCAKKVFTDKTVTVDNEIKKDVDCIVSAFSTTEFSYIEQGQLFSAPVTGIYHIELWGASGGGATPNDMSRSSRGGAGAYTSGLITLEKGERLYIYTGGKGNSALPEKFSGGGYNGGGNGFSGKVNIGYGGGGATDVRLVSGTWNNFESLKSRIMVAAGGGGTDNIDGTTYKSSDDGSGGSGGTLIGENAYVSGKKKTGSATTIMTSPSTGILGYGLGGSQTGGYRFGQGESATYGYEDEAGAGSGYYGGLATNYNDGGGAGGSSFISGYTGCDAIASNSTESNIIHTGQPNHYSGKVFTNSVMIDGLHTMPSTTGVGEMIGNAGNGFARITLVSVN